MQVKYDSRTFLPRLNVFHAGTGEDPLSLHGRMCHQGNVSPDNGVEAQWHIKLGHLGFAHVTKLGQVAIFGPLGFKSESDQSLPHVLVILPDKSRKPSGHKHVTVDESRSVGSPKLNPGDLVLDH
jgi:hypothetical protein